MKAIIELSGKQYLVEKGTVVTVDSALDIKNALKVSPLLVIKDEEVAVGAPVVSKAEVSLKKVAESKSDKIRSIRFKAKKRVKKIRGHRQDQTALEVTSITIRKK